MNSPASPTPQPKAPSKRKEHKEEDAFRRIHYHQEVLKYRATKHNKGHISQGILAQVEPPESQPISDPFLLVVLSGDESLARTLLDKGANPNSSEGGQTALYLASMSGSPEMVKILLGEGESAYEAMDKLLGTSQTQEWWSNAEEQQLRVYKKLKEELGETHNHTLVSMLMLSLTFQKEGKGKEAESLCLQALASLRECFSNEKSSNLESLSQLAHAFRSQGRWKETEELEV